jgi:hypothetical protein
VTGFVAQLAFDSFLLFVFSIPLILVAQRHGRSADIRKYLIAGAIVVVFSSIIAFSSEQLVERCFAAGNISCNDFGSAGFRFLLMGGYAAFALIEAYLIAQD